MKNFTVGCDRARPGLWPGWAGLQPGWAGLGLGRAVIGQARLGRASPIGRAVTGPGQALARLGRASAGLAAWASGGPGDAQAGRVGPSGGPLGCALGWALGWAGVILFTVILSQARPR